LREGLKSLSSRLLEKKRSAGAAARCATEKELLSLWRNEGFAVPQWMDDPLPAGVSPPALWMEYCPGPTLDAVVRDESVPLARKRKLLQQAGHLFAQRQRRAMERNDPRLIQEHATTKHLIVQAQRLVTFDLENTFAPGVSLPEAMAQELAGLLRPLLRRAGPEAGAFLAAFVEGYGDPERLRLIAQHAVHGRGLSRRLKRWQDQRRRTEWPKTEVLRRMLDVLKS
jgi:tRNA A-37 threonylcarbamoyl transferase component Bud32